MKNMISEFANGNKTNLILYDGSPAHTKSLNVIIVTRERSGSSFLGDLLNSYPGTFYSYEPLFGTKILAGMKKDMTRNKIIDIMLNTFKCKPPQLPITDLNNPYKRNFRLYEKLPPNILNAKKNMWKLKEFKELFSTSCKTLPIRLVKTIRLQFEDAESLLLDPEIGKTLKIVFLFRDPKGR